MKSPKGLSASPWFTAVSFFAFVVFFVAIPASAADWTHWRGPEQNGVSHDKDLPEKFDPDTGENIIWKAPIGGRSTPVVMNGRVYLIGYSGSGLTTQERMICLEEATGKQLQEVKFNVFYTSIVTDRLGWTYITGDPATGYVYAHGTGGLLTCFDKDLKQIWQHSLTEEYGRISGYGGRLTSPVLDGDLLIMSIVNASWGELARGGCRFVAFDKKTGAIVWWTSTGLPVKATNFSYPVVKVINGQRLLICGGADGAVHALKVGTGEKVWSYVFSTSGINLTPVVDGTRVYVGHGEGSPEGGKQGRFLCLDAGDIKEGKPKLVWKVDGILAKFSTAIVDQGKVYVNDDTGTLFCLDANTGKKLWDYSYGAAAMGSPILADGKIYVGEVNDYFYILKPEAKGCQELHKQFFPPPKGAVAGIEINGSPAVANGRVYIQTSAEIYCVGKKNAKGSDAPATDKEPAADPNAKPTLLQVFPADVVLAPGGMQEFKARTFDAQGRFIKEVKVAWSTAAMLPPPPLPNQPVPPAGQPTPPPPPDLKGTITEAGMLTVDATPGQFGRVIAKLDGLEGYARVRVAPNLPYKQDFAKVPNERTPGGWINSQGKFQVVELKGEKVLKKMANNSNPLVARANTFFTMPGVNNYTIQADVMGVQMNEKDMPDGGVLNCRYGLILDGNKQRLRLVSYEDLPRIDKNIGFAWKPETWYTMKLTVTQKGDKALIEGKVWPKGQSEPANSTLSFEDPVPNKEGSPGLYGYATGILEGAIGAEFYYDNVDVKPIGK